MVTDSINISDLSDARSYVIPISSIIEKRIRHISKLNTKLSSLVAKLYLMPDEEDKNEICAEISGIISEIELLVLKNIDDAQIIEYSLAELTLKDMPIEEIAKKPDHPDQHIYA